MNTEQVMAAAHERLTEIIKSKRVPRKLKKKNKKKAAKWAKDCIDYAIKNGFKPRRVNYDIVFNTKPEFKDLKKYYGN